MFFMCVAVVTAAVAAAPPASTHDYMLSGFLTPPLNGKVSTVGDHGREISGEALTVALDVVQAWAVFLTLGFTLIIFLFLAFCVCSTKDDGYDEFEITQGITTVKVSHDGGENGVSLIPRINGSGTESLKATDETSEASSRYTMKRELPAIPTITPKGEDHGREKLERPTSQHSSDLYASLNEPTQGGSSFKLIGGVQVLPAGAVVTPGGRAALVKESVSSPEDGPITSKLKDDRPLFSQTKNFALTKDAEHPYAKLTTPKSHEAEGTTTETSDGTKFTPKDSRRTKSEGIFHSSALVPESVKDSSVSILPSSEIYNISKDDTNGSVVAPGQSPHLTTLDNSTVSLHSNSGHSPTLPDYCSPTTPQDASESAPIPAAMAISGRTPANEEMPYMTPPVIQPNGNQTEHYSGDSQDSRGYTSISVREPLAALKARQAAEGVIAALSQSSGKSATTTQASEGEGYYMTVSDDSADEMYACIYEGGRGTGSETYAQIEPRSMPSSHAPPSVLSTSSLPSASPTGLSGRTPQDPSPPAPPSVDSLRHVVHSRQASASSSASAGMGSPIAEKRGTRSPLPPLPQGDTALYSPLDPPALSSQPIPKSPPNTSVHASEKPTPRSLEEMYAKVLKKPGHSRGSSSGVTEGNEPSEECTSTGRNSSDGGRGTRMVVSPTSKPDMTHSLVETRSQDATSPVNRVKSCEVSVSWGRLGPEEVPKKGAASYDASLYSGSDPGYETVKNGDPPYASVDSAENYPGYETVRNSDLESEPGYETVKHKEFEPGYETVSELISKKATVLADPGYESVTTTEYEPGYETLSSKQTSEPGYESVSEKSKLMYDPGYEELAHPSLERPTSETDPNYEQLKFSTQGSDGKEVDNGYEVVLKESTARNYELVSDYDAQIPPLKSPSPQMEPSITVPLYASINKREKPTEEKVDVGAPRDEEVQGPGTATYCIDFPNQYGIETEILKPDTIDDAKVSSELNMVEDSHINDGSKDPECPQVFSDEKFSHGGLILDNRPSEEVESHAPGYEVMDSPEEVELPLPGEEDNQRVSLPLGDEPLKTEAKLGDQEHTIGALSSRSLVIELEKEFEDLPQPMVSLNLVEASPQQSSSSRTNSTSSEPAGGSPKEDQLPRNGEKEGSNDVVETYSPEKEKPLVPVDVLTTFSITEESFKTFPESSIQGLDPLPPPPLPVLDDDLAATASPPPPPPPPIPDEMCNLQDLPPPPLSTRDTVETVNGFSPTSSSDLILPAEENFSLVQVAPLDLPVPLPTEEGPSVTERTLGSSDSSIGKGTCINGGMNVTVNPMAEFEECVGEVPPTQHTPPLATERLPQPSFGTPGAPSADSQSSGSTVNGSGSVESVVTVDPKSGADPATIVPSPPVSSSSLEHSSSTSSSESKHSAGANAPASDLNEGITPV